MKHGRMAMRKRDLKNVEVGDEVLVETYDYAKDDDAILCEVVTEVNSDSLCTVGYAGDINFYDSLENDLRRVKGKTGRHFPEMAKILAQLKEDSRTHGQL